MIRVICQNCESKINAKDELLGQRRNCPKCKSPILIQPMETPAEQIHTETPQRSPEIIVNDGATLEASDGRPLRLLPLYRYFVLGFDRLVAHWESAKSWQVNAGAGFANPRKNPELIPDQGTFAFVELAIKNTDEGQKMTGLRIFKITLRGALTSLGREEVEILSRLDGPGTLMKAQKNMLMGFLQKNYMFDFLSQGKVVTDYLMSEDITSSQVGEV